MPRLRLRREPILVLEPGPGEAAFREVETGVIDLAFDYGDFIVAAADESVGDPSRDVAGEAEARRVLEAHGAVDLTCLDDCATLPGSTTAYAVHLDGDPDVLCAFGSRVIPRLESMGWRVEVDRDYPCHVVEATAWYAAIGEPDDGDDRDWFELELGVEIDGHRVDVLPLLVELIETRGSLESITRPGRDLVALPLGDGRYLPVACERLAPIARVLQELHEIDGVPRGGSLRLPTFVPDYLDRIEEALHDSVRWEGDAGVRARIRGLSRPAPALEAPPRGLRATLRPYQARGLAFLQHLRAHGAGGILADDMGLGKTLQTIAHIVAEKEAGRLVHPALVVAPTSLVANWVRELERFAPFLRVLAFHGTRRRRLLRFFDDADVIITTYPLLVRDAEAFEGRAFHLQILDEAQAIKNARSRAHQACAAIEAEHRLCLTGTPVENHLEEVWAQFDFVMPGFLGDAATFRSAFRTPIERDGNAARLETLRQRLAPFVLRRMKDDVITELPPKTEILRPTTLRGSQRDLYESIRIAAHAEVRRAVATKGIAASTIDILGALMKLRQVCCDPRLVRVSGAQEVEVSAKFDLLFEMLTELLPQGRRVLVFSQFTSMLALIEAELRRRRISHVGLTGETTNRQQAVDAFQNGRASVFLISLKAGGTGLNLTAADTVIHYDPWWNPAVQAQATDRAHRMGQRRPVFVYNLIVAGSVEERMLDLQRRKRALADGLLAEREEASTDLSEAEVDSLFAPLAPGTP